jgi:hypothetical protein
VLVEEGQFWQARACLKSAHPDEHLLQNEVCCLACGSPNVEFPQFTRNTFMPTMFGVLLSALGIVQKSFYCRECHYSWPMKEKLHPHTDILGWPTNHGGVAK